MSDTRNTHTNKPQQKKEYATQIEALAALNSVKLRHAQALKNLEKR